VNRGRLLDVLKSNNLGTDCDRRIFDFLLNKTKLIVRMNRQFGNWFDANVGILQGGSLSPLLFIVYLEAALKSVWQEIAYEVQKMVYADDIDFISLQNLDIWKIKKSLENGNLNWIVQNRNNQNITWWQWVEEDLKLGIKLGTKEDIKRRKALAMCVMNKRLKIWSEKEKWIRKRRFEYLKHMWKASFYGSTSFWRDHFGVTHFVVALFGVAKFVAGLFMSGPFWHKFHKNFFFFLLLFSVF